MDPKRILATSVQDLTEQPRIALPAIIGFLVIAATYAVGLRILLGDARELLTMGATVDVAARVFLTTDALVILGVATLIAYAISLVAAGASLAMCTAAARGKRATLKESLKNAKKIPKYIGLRLLVRVATLIPLLILIPVPRLWNTSPLAGLALALVALVAFLLWTLFIELRFLLGAPEVFLERSGVALSLRHSYGRTGRAIGAAITVGAVLLLAMLLQGVLRGPVNEAWTALIIGTTPTQAVLAAIAAVAGAVILGGITTLQHSFLLHSHRDFPKDS